MADFETLEDRSYLALQRRMLIYEHRANDVLRNALDQIRIDMSKIYEKHAVDGKLSLADMTRYNRLATMEKQAIGHMTKAARANIATFDHLRPEMYQESFFHHAWAIDQDSGVRIAWGVLNKDVITENLASEFYRISRATYGPEARTTVRRALNTGLAQGKSYTAMMKDLRKAFGITASKAMRIIRTEGQTAVNAGQFDLYTRAEAKGIEGRQIWDATLDDRTRPTTKAARAAGFNHRIMDGRAKGEDGLFHFPTGPDPTAPFPAWQGLRAGNRIHCRCRVRFQIDEYPPQIRRTRTEGIIPYTTYSDWEPNARIRVT